MWQAIVRALAFGTAISVASVLTSRCGTLSGFGPRNIPLQPPDWVFGVVWPCLYVTTGAAWARGGADVDVLLGAVTLLCCSWLATYVCLRWKLASALVLVTAAGLTTLLAATSDAVVGGLLAPLAAWTAFASYLNVYDVARGQPPAGRAEEGRAPRPPARA